MSGRGSRAMAARLLSAAASAALASAPAFAQTAAAASVSRCRRARSFRAARPDARPRGRLARPQRERQRAASGAARRAEGQAAASAVTDENNEIRYSLSVEGLAAIGNSEDLLKAFRQQSALEADRKHPANAAQIGRRSSADADLLTELLRSQGYYDASVEPRTEARGLRAACDPGRRSRPSNIASPRSSCRGWTRPARTPRSCATRSR